MQVLLHHRALRKTFNRDFEPNTNIVLQIRLYLVTIFLCNQSSFRFRLAKWPIFRDLLFYVVSVLLLLIVTLYGITWYGAFILLLASGGYFSVLLLGRKIEPMLKGFFKVNLGI